MNRAWAIPGMDQTREMITAALWSRLKPSAINIVKITAIENARQWKVLMKPKSTSSSSRANLSAISPLDSTIANLSVVMFYAKLAAHSHLMASQYLSPTCRPPTNEKIQGKIRALVVVAIVVGLAAAYMLLSAITTASVRYAHCGPSSLSAQDQYCRIASELLIGGYLALAISVVLIASAIWLRLRIRRPKGDGRN